MASSNDNLNSSSRNNMKESDTSQYDSASEDSDTDGYVTPNEEFEPSEVDEERIKKALKEAEELKAHGSDHFRAGSWNEALQDYQRALLLIPPKPSEASSQNKGKGRETDLMENDSEVTEDVPSESELDQECAKARAVLNGNIGACYVKLSDQKKVVEACTAALSDDPKYIKILQRRAVANEALGTWASLTSAEQDYTKLLEILPANSPLLPDMHRAIQKLKPRKEVAQSAEMEEMMGKLKGLGNSILGNFGLSTDNFKFEPNGQGGYSMNFVR